MSELFDMVASVATANAETFQSGWDAGFKAGQEIGYNTGYIAGLKKADEIREEVFHKDKEVKI